jgi:hypothetical protein
MKDNDKIRMRRGTIYCASIFPQTISLRPGQAATLSSGLCIGCHCEDVPILNWGLRLMTKAQYRDFGCFIGYYFIIKLLGANAIRPYTKCQNESKGIRWCLCQQPEVPILNRDRRSNLNFSFVSALVYIKAFRLLRSLRSLAMTDCMLLERCGILRSMN